MKRLSAETSRITRKGTHSNRLLRSAMRSITTQPSGLCSAERLRKPWVLCNVRVRVESWEVTVGFDKQRHEIPAVVGVLFV